MTSSAGEEASATTICHRHIEVCRPSQNEVPAPFAQQGCDPDDVRVAKVQGRIVGAYWLVPGSDEERHCFRIRALAVCRSYRGKGIGLWLLAHALGIAEVRGGRTVTASIENAAFFRKLGFETDGAGTRLDLTAE